MTFQKTPGGSRGRRGTRTNAVSRFVSNLMVRQHRRSGDRFMGMDLLYLSTKGAHSSAKPTAVPATSASQSTWSDAAYHSGQRRS
jgi:hypothetical protein